MDSLVHNFSALGEYQKAHTLSYSGSREQCGFRLTLSQRGETVRTESVLVDLPPEQAEQVLCFLYENCVPIETWTDVLKELLPAGTIKITRESETVR